MKRSTKEAFIWIIKILKRRKVPYQLTGGFAARIYGSKRLLADIDIEIPDRFFSRIILDIKKYITFGPANYKDKNFSTHGVALKYRGQIIELCGTDSEKLYNLKKKKWIKSKIDLSKSVKKKVFGMTVHMVRKKDLIYYKGILMRKVDKEDLKVLKNA